MGNTEKTGILERIIFHKPDTNFVIGNFVNHEKKESFKAVGNIVNPTEGMTYKLSGDMQSSPYGEQLRIKTFETVKPQDINGIFKYLVRTCKFVGVETANKLIEKYGEKTLDIMRNDPDDAVSKIKGITLDRAKEIQQTLIDNEDNEKVIVELESLLNIEGMRKDTPSKLYTIYKSNAAEILKNNPYVLTGLHGISFILADRVAIKIKFPPDHIERKKAACLHIIKEKMSGGSLWVKRQDLLSEMSKLIIVQNLIDGINVLADEKIITKKVKNKTEYYAFLPMAEKEKYIGKKIAQMAKG